MNIDIKLHKKDLPDDLKLGNVIAVDGEFMGLNVKRDPLCLVQVSTGNSDAHIIQLDRSKYDAPNLIKILEDNKIKKIFHYGRADLAHIKYYLKTDTNNIEDIDISKQFQSSDFGGELNNAQLKYCANDVIYLHEIYTKLEEILVREKRINLYKDCLKFLKTRVDLDLAQFKDDIWSH